MSFDWEIAYMDLDALQMVLKNKYGGRLIPMIVFDIAHLHDWKVGDAIEVELGQINMYRQIQKNMNLPMDEEDYLLTNQRTGGKAPIRKNDYECEDAQAWLLDLQRRGLV